MESSLGSPVKVEAEGFGVEPELEDALLSFAYSGTENFLSLLPDIAAEGESSLPLLLLCSQLLQPFFTHCPFICVVRHPPLPRE